MTAPVSLNLTSPIPPPREAVILDVITAPPRLCKIIPLPVLREKLQKYAATSTVVIYTPKGQVVAAPPQGTASLRTGQTVSIDVTPATTAGTKTLSITITVMPTPPRAPTSSTSATTVPATTPPALQNYAQDLQQLLTARTAPKGTAPSPGLQPGQVIALQRLTIAQLINLLPNSTISPQIFELPRISTPLMTSPGNVNGLNSPCIFISTAGKLLGTTCPRHTYFDAAIIFIGNAVHQITPAHHANSIQPKYSTVDHSIDGTDRHCPCA